MKIAAVLLLLSSAVWYGLASPLLTAIDDTAILNYALTLEYLESKFYTDALAKFSDSSFTSAGYSHSDRQRFAEIANHEASHVAFLQKALGNKATKACTYNFPYTDVTSFIALSMALEGVGVSAYLGAAQYITNKDYLTAAASVLTTESRHAAWVSAVMGKQAAWGGALDTPLGLNQVYTLAASMIVSCPSSNPTLPVKAFPSLSLITALPGFISQLTFKSTDMRAQGQYYVAFFSGLSVVYSPVLKTGVVATVIIPLQLAKAGQVYAVVTAENGTANDLTILAGPTILNFADYTKSI